MVKILGTLFCTECKNYEEEDVDMNMQCPKCKSFKIKHTPPHKIRLCENDNPEGFGKSGIGNIHKKIKNNNNGQGQIFDNLLKMIIKENEKTWTASELIDIFDVTGYTEGDVIRPMLNLLVCQGYLSKTFMKNKSFHLYIKNKPPYKQCPYMTSFEKGKKIGIRKCKFNFKEYGEELDSYKIFNNGGKSGDKEGS